MNKVLRSCDRNVSDNDLVSLRTALQAAWYHDNQLSITFYTCVSFGKMKGEIDTEQFMEEIRKYDCSFNSSSKEFKDKFKKINAWSKVGEVFSISPAAAEKKFRDVRTAYGRYLRRRKSVPSGSGRNAVPIPREFVNLEWLSVHIEHREPFADSVVTNCYDRLRSYVNMLCAIFGWVVSAIVRSPAIVCDYMWTRLNGPQCP